MFSIFVHRQTKTAGNWINFIILMIQRMQERLSDWNFIHSSKDIKDKIDNFNGRSCSFLASFDWVQSGQEALEKKYKKNHESKYKIIKNTHVKFKNSKQSRTADGESVQWMIVKWKKSNLENSNTKIKKYCEKWNKLEKILQDFLLLNW